MADSKMMDVDAAPSLGHNQRLRRCPIPGLSEQWHIIPIPDGRQCRVCQTDDETPDYCFPQRPWLWAYPVVKATQKNQGKVCMYCFRTYLARFACRRETATISLLVAALGTDEAKHKVCCYETQQ